MTFGMLVDTMYTPGVNLGPTGTQRTAEKGINLKAYSLKDEAHLMKTLSICNTASRQYSILDMTQSCLGIKTLQTGECG